MANRNEEQQHDSTASVEPKEREQTSSELSEAQLASVSGGGGVIEDRPQALTANSPTTITTAIASKIIGR